MPGGLSNPFGWEKVEKFFGTGKNKKDHAAKSGMIDRRIKEKRKREP